MNVFTTGKNKTKIFHFKINTTRQTLLYRAESGYLNFGGLTRNKNKFYVQNNCSSARFSLCPRFSIILRYGSLAVYQNVKRQWKKRSSAQYDKTIRRDDPGEVIPNNDISRQFNRRSWGEGEEKIPSQSRKTHWVGGGIVPGTVTGGGGGVVGGRKR